MFLSQEELHQSSKAGTVTPSRTESVAGPAQQEGINGALCTLNINLMVRALSLQPDSSSAPQESCSHEHIQRCIQLLMALPRPIAFTNVSVLAISNCEAHSESKAHFKAFKHVQISDDPTHIILPLRKGLL